MILKQANVYFRSHFDEKNVVPLGAMAGPQPRILFEDEDVLVVDKPAGLLSQGDRSGAPSLVDFARQYLKKAGVGVVHRLDRNVSGVCMIAKHQEAAAHHARAFSGQRRGRCYEAISIARRSTALALQRSPAFTIEAALSKDDDENFVRIDPNGKSASTQVALQEARACISGVALRLAIELQTGRSHQIRVHLAHAELPIAGDTRYGADLIGLTRPLLHAVSLTFVDRQSKDTKTVTCPAPFRLDDVLTLRKRSQRTPKW